MKPLDFLKDEVHPSWILVILLLIIAGMATIIGLGKVEQVTSYGLDIVLGCLSTLAGAFGARLAGATRKEEAALKGNPPAE